MQHIVKRHGHNERFDERKAYASCYAACLNVPLDHEVAEKISAKVVRELKQWIKTKRTVTSHQIFKAITRFMKKHDKQAAFMYDTHRDVN